MIPDFETLLVPLLRMLSAGEGLSRSEMVSQLVAKFKLSHNDAVFLNRLTWTMSYLKTANFIFVGNVSVWITKRGRAFLRRNPKSADRFDLIRESEEFARHMYEIEMRRTGGRNDERVLAAISHHHPDATQTTSPTSSCDQHIWATVTDWWIDALSLAIQGNTPAFERSVLHRKWSRRQRRILFARDSATIANSGADTTPRQIPDTSFWVMTKFSTPHKKEILRKVLYLLAVPSVDITKILHSISRVRRKV